MIMPPTLARADSRRKQHPASLAKTSNRHSVMSVRSFAAFEKDDDEGKDAANIHEILGRRPSVGASVAETVASPATFRKIWAETASLALSNNPGSQSNRPNSIRSNPERSQSEILTTAPLNDPQCAETRSPSSADRSLLSISTSSRGTSSTSSPALRNSSASHGLQSKGSSDRDELKPLLGEDIDPSSFSLVSPCSGGVSRYSLETRSKALFSKTHLQAIFDDPLLLQRFKDFLYAFRPKSVPLLIYYLDASKALKAINYANAISRSLTSIQGLEFTQEAVPSVTNESLLGKANSAFETLVNDHLPAYITHTWIQMVGMVVKRRVTNTLPEHLRDLSDGLAEVFCLTDPSRPDNPILFASKGFHTMTQYGVDYALGRNCRFLQGPYTNRSSVKRIKEQLEAGKEHCETILNYRRDGSPFMNLIMVAPLIDNRGVVRYHMGCQVDVSGLAKECTCLESLRQLVHYRRDTPDQEDGGKAQPQQRSKDKIRQLAEMFNVHEMRTAREASGATQSSDEDIDGDSSHRDADLVFNISSSSGSQLRSIYENYLVVRPYPTLRVLFASPPLRFPGMLQCSFMSRIGGSQSVREEITQAFIDGRDIATKIRWVTKTDSYGKGRWIHCTPLFGINGAVGAWIVILVDDDEVAMTKQDRRAPPVDLRTTRRRSFEDDTECPPTNSVNEKEQIDESCPPSATSVPSKS
ncbi:uncharacterized protein F4807DRAFT_441217 [Annulohypoxylon truncatum]|uniref:uncharacterized protein n=1 Tax=Annulohypoxylon truncatum TaxID=327061 RepID=UPI00200867E1|nr:uncharacterized protein F4807DRAFT_441217 [Annulohypoxylon truncatum]KAI1205976.1 hypothetical protein F4807DRAFT_441217 [Annulohypoxylon truncatum]